MSEKRQPILFREMILDLHYRLRLVDDLFCSAAESLVSAAALEDWKSRSEVILKIRAYSQALQIINADLCRIIEGKRAVFPADLSEWILIVLTENSRRKTNLNGCMPLPRELKWQSIVNFYTWSSENE